MRALALVVVACALLATGPAQEPEQQQAIGPKQAISPNAPGAPTVIVLDGGSSLGDWAAILTGAAALIAALGGAEVFRRRRRSTQP